ncbi:MAG: Gldg family protein [Thermoguttaceae bacterium]|nr:Gldg family protein [Thermoguttaceae bacterium]
MFAVFKRNFVSYFLNPTGYVFICVFVLLSSVAAFLPDEFVNSNLANLAQLNLWFPLIVLIFAPAISMNVWADERRFGTDELLTTQPITPLQIVLGKFFAVALVYTVSLLFSSLANFIILEFLGSPDVGLFIATYLGYWLIGLAVSSLASIVSYITSQLTVAYILGALICVPLVALKWADALPVSDQWANSLKSFAIDSFFAPFGRGVVSLSGLVYFLLIPALAVYICVILLNRKTWLANNPRRRSLRYLFRVVCFGIAAILVVGLIRDHDLSADWTEEKLSALSSETIKLIEQNYADYPIVIEARLSPQVPKEYVQTKLNVVSTLNELKNRSKCPIFLDIRDIVPNTEEAYRLERQYDIRPRKVVFDSRGQLREDSIFMSIIFRCGSKTIVIPFLNRGLSVEYELVSSLTRVTSPPKKRIGVIETEAGVLGRYDDYGREIQTQWPLIDELSKQYYIESVDPSRPISMGKYDVLVAMQPSSLGTMETINLSSAIRQGQPTLIFEDPRPIFLEFLPGTLEKRRPTPTNPVPPLKGEINLLWMALGVRFDGANVLWKNYNPYPKLAGLSEEYLFVDAQQIKYDIDAPSDANQSSEEAFSPFNKDIATVASLEHALFPFVGSLSKVENAETVFTPLVRTWAGGFSAVSDVVPMGIRTQSQKRLEKEDVYTLAAHITGPVPKAMQIPSDTKESNTQTPEYNVVVVADVDMATPGFFTLREMGTDIRSGVSFDFDNITLVLNLIDDLADEDDLIAIRSRRPKHRTLTKIEETTKKIRDKATVAQIAYMKEFEEERRKEEDALQKTIQKLASQDDVPKGLSREESLEIQSAIVAARQRLTKVLDDKKRLFDRKVEEEQREVDRFIRQTQSRYKTYAALIPPIPPLLVGLFVFVYRRRRQGRVYGF